MKKVLVTLLIAAVSTTAFAAKGGPENTKALNTFKHLFGNATQVQWSLIDETDLTKASFMYKGVHTEAFFNNEGDMIAAGRYISPKQLPQAVARALEQQYAGYGINPQVIEYEADGETLYYITLASKKQDVIVKATVEGLLSIYKKVKK